MIDDKESKNGSYKKNNQLVFIYLHSKIFKMLYQHSLQSYLFSDKDSDCMYELEFLRSKQKVIFENYDKQQPIWSGIKKSILEDGFQ